MALDRPVERREVEPAERTGGKPGLARVSATPGKTTLLNAYRLPGFYLLDLPGYGFARAAKACARGLPPPGHPLPARASDAGGRRVAARYSARSFQGRSRDAAAADPERPAGRSRRSPRPTSSAASAAENRPREIAVALGITMDQVQLTSARSGLGIQDLAASIVVRRWREPMRRVLLGACVLVVPRRRHHGRGTGRGPAAPRDRYRRRGTARSPRTTSSLRIRTPDIDMRFIPLDARVTTLLAQDSWESLRSLVESRRASHRLRCDACRGSAIPDSHWSRSSANGPTPGSTRRR